MSKVFTKKQDFVGLSNQGATCYMNSLLQTLYMTPEFRKEIYKWKYDQKEGKRDLCIILQLQLLFSKLQISQSHSIETTGLTQSFGWDQRESFQQHDVQEFCRVLFDAIEKSVKDTDQSNLIQKLYEGKYVDYVKCLKCNNESVREDKFLDLSLTIRNKFENVYNDSIEKALDNFVRPEHLNGDNKYHCDHCGSKEDAIKGLKFKELPYILVLHLKRFDFDYSTNHRIKINDKVSFQEIMNLNSLLGQAAPVDMEIDSKADGVPYIHTDLKNKVFKFQVYKKKESLEAPSSKEPIKMDSASKKRYKEVKSQLKSKEKDEKIKKFMEQGENVYELYSVMIHSGSAWGGHYFAYIKSFETSKWYNFNDSDVSEISSKELSKTFGENTSWGSSSNAYLLMYRKIDPALNLIKIDRDEVPQEIFTVLEQEKKKAIEEENFRLEESKKILIRVKYKNCTKEVFIKRDEKIAALKTRAMLEHGIKEPEENVRLRELNYNGNMTGNIDENLTVSSILSYNKQIGLEVKKNDQEFEDYDPTKLPVQVVLWTDQYDAESDLESISYDADIVMVSRFAYVRDFVRTLAANYQIPLELIKVTKRSMRYSGYEVNNLNTPEMLKEKITSINLETTLFYVEKVDQQSQKGKWEELFELEKKKTVIQFNDPLKTNAMIIYDLKIFILPTKTMRELKSMISNKLKIPEDNFIMRKIQDSKEFKDLSQKIESAISLPPKNVLLEMGTPLDTNQMRFKLSVAVPRTEFGKDGEAFKIYNIQEITGNLDWVVRELKEFLVANARERYPSLDIQFYRLREVNNDKLVRWLDDSIRLQDLNSQKLKEIAIQILDQPDKIREKDDIIVSARLFHPSSWELDPVVEVIISSKSELKYLSKILSQKLSIQVILMQEDNLEFYKVSQSNFTRGELKTAKFENYFQSNDKLFSYPAYISEGSLLM